MSVTYSVYIIIIVALMTAVTRFLPFVIFSGKRKTPKYVSYLGEVLPYAIMAMLVVYSLKSVSFIKAPYGFPEIISALTVIFLHLWRRNSLISIGVGTITYMILIQTVFSYFY